MASNGPYSDKDRLAYNRLLKELQTEQEGHEKAIAAGIDEVQPILDKCVDCQERIKRIKAAYFPSKP
jgi:hypothetical protein